MDKHETIEMIRALSEAAGPSGFEDEVVAVLRGYGQALGSLDEDAMRNLYLRRKGRAGGLPVLMLDAHSDEVGFMVQGITAGGMLKFVPLGGWVPSSVPAHRVKVRGADGDYITGIVASKPPHHMGEAERKAAPVLADMVIDVGAKSREDAVQNYRLRIGEPVVPDTEFEWQPRHGTLMGKAFDCRLGCAALLATLQRLAGEELGTEVVASFSAQEEVGTRGARVMADTIRPDAAIVFEGCPADDVFGPADAAQAAMGKGPMLRFFDSGMIANPRFQRFALDVAEELSIPVQASVRTSGGTNGGAIHLAGAGVPVIVISLPVRYIHTHQGIADYSDFEAAVTLAAEIIQRMDAERIASF